MDFHAAEATTTDAAESRTAESRTTEPRATESRATEPLQASRLVIQYGGQRFSCTPEMAQIFLKHAREVIESGEQELVPLLHSSGIELLLVSRLTPYSLIQPE